MAKTRNILLIGKTGNGKSTLANVLTDTNDFEEVEGGTSGTKDAKIREFEFDNITYRVIDTVGLGDTELSKQEVLNRLRKAEHIICDGLSQILFVISNRFTKEEIEVFDLLGKVIFDKKFGQYTTIVYTKFPNFRDNTSCEENIRKMKENSKFAEIINSCNGFIHVNNPPLNVKLSDEEERELTIRLNKKMRSKSQERLLDHLKTCQKIYQPELLAKFKKIIAEFDSIIKEISQGISSNSEIFDNNIKQIENFVIERERIIKELEEHEEKIVFMKNKSTAKEIAKTFNDLSIGTLSSSVSVTTTRMLEYVSNTDSFKPLQENQESLIEEDKEKVRELSQSWVKLIEESKSFREKINDVNFRFNKSEYKNQEINKEKIKIVEEVIIQAQILQVEPKGN